MSTRFDLIDLRLFVHVAEAGSITHGAVRAHMTLASASERIRAMEDALSAPLLERKRRGVQLTSAGRVLLHHAWVLTQQLEQMRGDLANFGKGLRGHVRLLSNIGSMEFLPAPLAAFLSAHPNIDVDLEHHGSGEIVRAIAAGHGDIGIVGETVDPAAELENFPFAEIRLVLVTPLRHPLSRRRKIAFREALDREFVGFAAGSPMQDLLNYHAFRAGRRLKLRIRLNGSDLMCQMVEKGIGVAILPETAARRCQQSMAIQVIPLTDTWALRQLTICVRSFRSLPVHAQRLVEFLSSGTPVA
ncbi:MAG TPA: LysR family transcriptional regulator [Xanthobacteraceae bacterium]|nr:LysR family transcriptional regulator [Xanthobacteraceae bacterium]